MLERIQVNPAFPLFVDDSREQVRLGDFPPTGRILSPAEKPLRELFRLCARRPRSRQELYPLLDGVTPGEIDAAIDRLLAARLLVTETDLAALTADDRLSRQALFLSMFHPAGQAVTALRDLAARRVTVLGAGAIGGAVAVQLVTAGVRRLTLVDDDQVEPSNLHRQHLYTPADVGRPKVAAAADRLRAHQPDAEIVEIRRRIQGAADVPAAGEDFVVNTVDTPQPHIRRWVNQACVQAGVPFVTGGFNQHVGLVGPLVVPGRTGCLTCRERRLAEPYGTAELPTADNAGRTVPAFGPLCAAVSGLLAAEIVRHLTGTGAPALEGRTVHLDLLDLSTTAHPFERLPGCEVCG
ncbi:TOMM precursor leader peptide-binding protein [Nonomuraea sp. NPDC003804]|uniref:TOMM precursor leader peptide-binding protein n=1 Tax=Nonomuraea sp. NPDC003804 TaxID=3154547 RepID=UPI0033BCFE64